MLLTFSVSWMWHINEMNSKARMDKSEDEALIANTERIAAYRDVLKEKGKEGAVEYLETLSLEIHGTD